MTVEGKVRLSAGQGARYAIDGGGWLVGHGLFDVRYAISPVQRRPAGFCEALRISSLATDAEGREYRLEQDLDTYDLYRMVVAEPLRLRSDEVRETDFGGRARRTTETVVLTDLEVAIDRRENRPIAVLSQPAPGQGTPTVTYFLFREKYAVGRFSLAWLRHDYAGAEPGAGPMVSLMLYMTLDGERRALTASALAIAGDALDTAAVLPIDEREVLASRLEVATIVWRRWREPEGARPPEPFVLTATGRVGTPTPAFSTVPA
jgi:hypothetical protein